MALSGSYVNTSNGSSSSSTGGGTTYAAGGEDALRTLLAQLLGGGTPEQRAAEALKQQQVQSLQGQQGDYSKQAAFTDAQGSVDQASRLALEKLIPSITKAAEGAGTSASSMRALLLQDSANKAAESASALGLKASTDYGNISNGLSQILASLTKGNPVTDALIQALQISKGTEGSSSTSSSSGNGISTTAGNALPMVNHQTWQNPFANIGASNLPTQKDQGMWSSGNGMSAADVSMSAKTPEEIAMMGRADAMVNGWTF